MKILRSVSAVLLALPLVVFGGNYFLDIFTADPGVVSDGTELLQAMRDGGLMAAIALSHVAVGTLLLVPRTRFLGGLVQLPISIGILSFHVAMLPEGNGMAAVLLVLNLGVIADPPRLRSLVGD